MSSDGGRVIHGGMVGVLDAEVVEVELARDEVVLLETVIVCVIFEVEVIVTFQMSVSGIIIIYIF